MATKNEPTNKALYAKVKADAKNLKSTPVPMRMAWCRNTNGGKYKKVKA